MIVHNKQIIFEDKDSGGYYILEHWREEETSDGALVQIYVKKEYYHSLESALKEM